ncbi:MAG: hypothetical protein QOC89_3473, partial [Paraburkholderia sp.]|nr:hypothetical protein [Paraburkholderia sp.]
RKRQHSAVAADPVVPVTGGTKHPPAAIDKTLGQRVARRRAVVRLKRDIRARGHRTPCTRPPSGSN